MKIRIKQISKATLWYSELRNEVFEVKQENENDFDVVNPSEKKGHSYFVFKEDAEIIKE